MRLQIVKHAHQFENNAARLQLLESHVAAAAEPWMKSPEFSFVALNSTETFLSDFPQEFACNQQKQFLLLFGV